MTSLPLTHVAVGVHVAADSTDHLREVPAASADQRTAARLPDWRRSEHLAARTLLRRLLAEVVGPSAAREEVAARSHGQPHLPARSDIGISLSHTDGWVAAAVHTGGGAIGVDAQAPTPVSDRLIRRCCLPADRAALAEMPETARDRAFAWVWTAQEACVKATGAGIAGLPWTIPVGVGQRHGRWMGFTWAAMRGRYPVAVSCAYTPTAEPTTESMP